MEKPFDHIEQISIAKSHKNAHKNLLQGLKKKKHGTVDNLFRQAHDEVFECTNCMDCGNCCRTTGPMYNQKDIEEISKIHLLDKQNKYTIQGAIEKLKMDNKKIDENVKIVQKLNPKSK